MTKNGDNIMRTSFRNVMSVCVLITLSLLLMTAGCVDSSQKISPQKNVTGTPPSTCSAEASVCTIDLPGSLRIDASPKTYSPLMSSTVGIGLTPNLSGFETAGAEFEWNATYGYFLDWSAPNFTVSRITQPVVNQGEKIYWSFSQEPASPRVPVIITVTLRDSVSQKPLAGSRMTLGWKDNLTVVVEKIE
ncbi:MAG: hypothetical protein LUQ54_06175 [Methanoregula sp.]|nr:hypothetical protein [Methanoregula sp.]